MAKEMTPAICAAAADAAIQKYIADCGAYGDAEKVRNAPEMLMSKCALGYGFVSNQVAMMDMCLRTAVHCGQRMEEPGTYTQGTVQ